MKARLLTVLLFVVMALLGLGLAGWYGLDAILASDWFERKARERALAEVERVFGWPAEAESAEFVRDGLTLTLRGLRVVGPDPGRPLLQVPEVRLGLRIDSLLRRKIVLRSILAQSPRLAVNVSEDGVEGFERFGQRPESEDLSVELAVQTIEARDAELDIDGKPYRFSLLARSAGLVAQAGADSCHGLTLDAAHIDAAWRDLRQSVASLRSRLRLCSGGVEVEQVSFAANRTEFSVSGSIESFQSPVVSLRYSAEGPVNAWTAFAAPEWEAAGTFRADGALRWEAAGEALSYQGSAEARGLALRSPHANVSGADARISYRGGLDAIELERVELELLGGAFRGRATLEQPFGVRRAAAEGEIEGIRLRQLLRSMGGAAARALDEWPWTARIGGSLRMNASSMDDIEASADIRLEAARAAERPVTGDLSVSYEAAAGRVLLHRADLRTDHSRIEAQGEARADGGSALRIRAQTSGREDWEALLAVTGHSEEDLRLEMRERLSVEGELEMRVRRGAREAEASFSGSFETGRIRLLNYDWDSLTADAAIDADGIKLRRVRLADGAGAASLSLDVRPLWDEPVAAWPVSGAIEGNALSVDKALSAAALPPVGNGLLGGSADLGGTVGGLEVDVRFEVLDGRLGALRAESVQGRAHAVQDRIEVGPAQVRSGNGVLTVEGEYERTEKTFWMKLDGAGWEAAALPALRDQHENVGGALRFNLEASGQMAPQIEGSDVFRRLELAGGWNLEGLRLAGRGLGDWTGEAATENGQIELSWRGGLAGGGFSGGATIEPASFDFRAKTEFSKLDAVAVAVLAGVPVRGLSGGIEGSLEASGNLAKPEEIEAAGVFDQLELRFSELPGLAVEYELWNPFPMRWSVSAGSLAIEHMRLQGQDTDIEVNGSVVLTSPRSVDLSLEGEFNLALLETLRPGLQASGQSAMNVRWTGGFDDPEIRGDIRFRNGAIRSDDFPNGLSAVEGGLNFTGREFRIPELTAASGGGRLIMSGGGRFGKENYEYRVSAEARRVRLRFPQHMSNFINGEVVISGARGRSLVTGEITIARAATSPEATIGDLIEAFREPARTPAADSILDDLQLNVHIVSAPGMEVETSLIRNVGADIDLRLVGTALNPSLLGRVSVNRGQMNFHGSRYRINRGEIEFINPFRIDPVLDFELETRIRNVDIGLILSGPARKLNISYRSDPPLSFSDLVNLVAVGRAPTLDPVLAARQRVEQQSLFQTGANTVFTQAVSRPVSPGLQRFFGVSRLKVDPQVGGAEANPAARISTEQQLTDDITLIYTFDLSAAQQQTIRVEWAPTRRWMFVLTRDENGLVGSDILYRTRLR